MLPASVGFQCPDCVKAGRKETRSGRTAYGGLRSSDPGRTSIGLIGLNVAVWLGVLVTGWQDSRLVDLLALRPDSACADPARGLIYPRVETEGVCSTIGGTTWLPGVADGAWWQLVTSMFLHVDIWHIAFNMLALWFLGPQLEAAIGRVRFLALYLLSGLAGSTLVYWLSEPLGGTLGASGAVFGLMGALLVVAFKVRGNVQGILVWLGINAVLTFTFPNISWQGHLGGLLGGAVLMAVIAYAPRERRTTWQVAGAGAFTVAVLAAIVVRTLALG